MQEQLSPTNPVDLSNPMVSIIIPCFNHAQYLGEAIGSVLGQSYDDYEIIVVDDGSTDDTRKVVSSFSERVRYIWQENQGLSAARNSGLRAARGELIGLLDADDLYEPEFISELVSVLQSNLDADGVYCLSRTVDVTNSPLSQLIGRVVPPEDLYRTLLKGGFFPPLCMFAYKDCYEALGLFDKTFQGAADWDMWLRISKRYNIIGLEKVLTRYRVLPDSMSRDPVHMQEDRMWVLKKHFTQESTDESNWSQGYRTAVAHSHIRATIEFMQSDNYERAYQHLKQSLILEPDLICDYDTFFKLGLASQPLGFRGEFATLDVGENAGVLLKWLDRIFHDPNTSIELKDEESLAYANAYWAFGQLSFGQRDFASARRYLWRAISFKPGYLLDRMFMSTLVKSLLPGGLVQGLEKRRRLPSIS